MKKDIQPNTDAENLAREKTRMDSLLIKFGLNQSFSTGDFLLKEPVDKNAVGSEDLLNNKRLKDIGDVIETSVKVNGEWITRLVENTEGIIYTLTPTELEGEDNGKKNRMLTEDEAKKTVKAPVKLVDYLQYIKSTGLY